MGVVGLEIGKRCCWLDVVGCSDVPSGGGHQLPMGEAMDRTVSTYVGGWGGMRTQPQLLMSEAMDSTAPTYVGGCGGG